MDQAGVRNFCDFAFPQGEDLQRGIPAGIPVILFAVIVLVKFHSGCLSKIYSYFALNEQLFLLPIAAEIACLFLRERQTKISYIARYAIWLMIIYCSNLKILKFCDSQLEPSRGPVLM